MANLTVTVKTSGGDYTTLNAALAAQSGDLVANTRILTIECYGMTDTTAAATGAGYTTSASYYIKIVSADRHNGTAKAVSGGTNYYLSTANSAAALSLAAEYTRVDGLEVSAARSSNYENAIGMNVVLGTGLIENNIVHDCLALNSNGSGYGIIYYAGCTIRNNIVYNTGDRAITAASGYSTDSIHNNTIYNYGTQQTTVAGFYAPATAGGTVKNNLVVKGANGGACYDYGGLTPTTNGGSDTSGEIDSLTAADLFTSVTASSEDLRLKAGADAINVGTDLSATFTTDIVGTTRPTGANSWDLGAFEYVAAAGGAASYYSSYYYPRVVAELGA
jgi:hypothetical protein